MNDLIIETQALQQTRALAKAIMRARTARIGRITGAPGTGKTIAGHFLVEEGIGDAVRICANACVSRKTLLQRLCTELELPTRGTIDSLLTAICNEIDGRLIVLDEANHLTWKHLEQLRYLPDEAGAGLLLIGTELLERSFLDGRTGVYLAQMARRIGGKQLKFMPMVDETEIAAYVIQPRFGKTNKTTAKAFHRAARGFWGEATELADACERTMKVNKISKLNETVITAAGRWLARRA